MLPDGQQEEIMTQYAKFMPITYYIYIIIQLIENEFNRIYNYFKKLKKQGSLTTDKRLAGPVAAKKEQNLKIWFYYVLNKSWKKGKEVAGQPLFSFPKNILIVLLYGMCHLLG